MDKSNRMLQDSAYTVEKINQETMFKGKRQIDKAIASIEPINSDLSSINVPYKMDVMYQIGEAQVLINEVYDKLIDLSYKLGSDIIGSLDITSIDELINYGFTSLEEYAEFIVKYGKVEDWENLLAIIKTSEENIIELLKQKYEGTKIVISKEENQELWEALYKFYREDSLDSSFVDMHLNENGDLEFSYEELENFYDGLNYVIYDNKTQLYPLGVEYYGLYMDENNNFVTPNGIVISRTGEVLSTIENLSEEDKKYLEIYQEKILGFTTEELKAIRENAGEYYSKNNLYEEATEALEIFLVPKWKDEANLQTVSSLRYTVDVTCKMMPYQNEMASKEFQEWKENSPFDFSESSDLEKALMRGGFSEKLKMASAEEKAYYYYLAATKGKDEASAFLEAYEDEFNRREGRESAEAVLKVVGTSNSDIYTAIATGVIDIVGLVDGLEMSIEGVGNAIPGVADGVLSANSYKQMYIMQALSENGIDINELNSRYKNGELTRREYESLRTICALGYTRESLDAKLASGEIDRRTYNEYIELVGDSTTKQTWYRMSYGASTSTGNMIIPMALNVVLKGSGTAWAAASSYGNALDQNFSEGMSGSSAYLNAGLNAIVEVLPEMFGPGLNPLSLAGDIPLTKQSFIKSLWDLAKTIPGETLEESLQNLGSHGVDFITGKPTDLKPEDLLHELKETILTTPLSVFMMGSTGKLINTSLSGVNLSSNQQEVQFSVPSLEDVKTGVKSDALLRYQNGEITYGEYEQLISSTNAQLEQLNKSFTLGLLGKKVNSGYNLGLNAANAYNEAGVEGLSTYIENTVTTINKSLTSGVLNNIKTKILDNFYLKKLNNGSFDEKTFLKLSESAKADFIREKEDKIFSVIVQQDFKLNFSAETLLTKVDGITLLERILKTNQYINSNIEAAKTNPKIAEILIKNRRIGFIDEATSEVLLTEVDGKTLLEKVFEIYGSNKMSSALEAAKTNPKIAEICIANNQTSFVSEAATEVLLTEVDGKTLLERSFEIDSYLKNAVIEAAKTNSKLAEICISNKNTSFVPNATSEVLLTEVDGKTLLERSFEISENLKNSIIDSAIKDIKIAQICLDNGNTYQILYNIGFDENSINKLIETLNLNTLNNIFCIPTSEKILTEFLEGKNKKLNKLKYIFENVRSSDQNSILYSFLTSETFIEYIYEEINKTTSNSNETYNVFYYLESFNNYTLSNDEKLKKILIETVENVNNIEELKTIYQWIARHEAFLFKNLNIFATGIKYDNYFIKDCVETFKKVSTSNDINEIKEILKTIANNSIDERNEKVHKFMFDYCTNFLQRGLISESDLNNYPRTTVEYDGKKIDFYTFDKLRYKFLVHNIITDRTNRTGAGPDSHDETFYDKLRDLVKKPELWKIADKTSGNQFQVIDCSFISNELGPFVFGGFNSKVADMPNLTLGFYGVPSEQVVLYKQGDAGSNPNIGNNAFYLRKNFIENFLGSLNPTNPYEQSIRTKYDEFDIRRYFSDGSTRIPDYIITTYPPEDVNNNKYALEWAKEYNIPIFYLNTNSYADAIKDYLTSGIYKFGVIDYSTFKNIVHNLEMYRGYDTNEDIKKIVYANIYESLNNIFENPTYESAKDILKMLEELPFKKGSFDVTNWADELGITAEEFSSKIEDIKSFCEQIVKENEIEILEIDD